MKAFLIARVSTEEQRDAGHSLPAQIVHLEKCCENKGFFVQRYKKKIILPKSFLGKGSS